MRITNRTRHTLLGSRVALASTWWSRLRGYLGRAEPRPGEGILLVDCNGIHTFGMRFALDIVFLDGKGKVLELVPSLRPWKKPRRVVGAAYVLEVPTGTIKTSGTQVGDELTWREQTNYSISVLSRNGGGRDQSSTESGRNHG